jgi:hypothetical protein
MREKKIVPEEIFTDAEIDAANYRVKARNFLSKQRAHTFYKEAKIPLWGEDREFFISSPNSKGKLTHLVKLIAPDGLWVDPMPLDLTKETNIKTVFPFKIHRPPEEFANCGYLTEVWIEDVAAVLFKFDEATRTLTINVRPGDHGYNVKVEAQGEVPFTPY